MVDPLTLAKIDDIVRKLRIEHTPMDLVLMDGERRSDMVTIQAGETLTSQWFPMPEIPYRAAKLIAKSPAPIVSMVVFHDRLFVATSDAVFERDEGGEFHEVRLVCAEPTDT